jgi:S-adenosylmethionine:tRNA ribosyltransferase-isomerase
MVFNDTKVVPARLHFVKPTGANIEIFCLEPIDPVEYNLAFASTSSCSWKCVIGNAKRWKGETLSLYNPDSDENLSKMNLRAVLKDRDERTGTVEFSWDDGSAFSSVLEKCGTVPIPPYLNRESESIDIERYQTLYAKIRGSVAAPTAGLHFTQRELDAIKAKGVKMETVCLHVGAGTFLPVKSQTISGHPMHREPFTVSLSFLKDLLEGGKNVVAVGTTSVRTLESLYYVGVSCIEKGFPEDVSQWAPYEREYSYTLSQSIEAIVEYLERNSLKELKIGTRIIIVPGFRFRVVDMMVTNFHHPKSSQFIMVSAFGGPEFISHAYEVAIREKYKFSTYGDAMLIL